MTENSRENASSVQKTEPYMQIHCFNVCYKGWIESLSKQMPELREQLEQMLDMIFAADQHGYQYPMYIFQWYTGPYIKLIIAEDISFFDMIAQDSKGRSMPVAFTTHFTKLDKDLQKRAWNTLKFLMKKTAEVYTDTYILKQ